MVAVDRQIECRYHPIVAIRGSVNATTLVIVDDRMMTLPVGTKLGSDVVGSHASKGGGLTTRKRIVLVDGIQSEAIATGHRTLFEDTIVVATATMNNGTLSNAGQVSISPSLTR